MDRLMQKPEDGRTIITPKRILRLASSCFSLSIFAVPRAPDLFAGSLQMDSLKAFFQVLLPDLNIGASAIRHLEDS